MPNPPPTDPLTVQAELIGRKWVAYCKTMKRRFVVHPDQVETALAVLMADFIEPYLREAQAAQREATWKEARLLHKECCGCPNM